MPCHSVQIGTQGHSGPQRACLHCMGQYSWGSTAVPGTVTEKPPNPDTGPSPPSSPSYCSVSSALVEKEVEEEEKAKKDIGGMFVICHITHDHDVIQLYPSKSRCLILPGGWISQLGVPLFPERKRISDSEGF